MCLHYISRFTKDLENQEVPGWTKDFWPEVTGFVLLVLVPIPLNLNFLGGFRFLWKPTFVCSLLYILCMPTSVDPPKPTSADAHGFNAKIGLKNVYRTLEGSTYAIPYNHLIYGNVYMLI